MKNKVKSKEELREELRYYGEEHYLEIVADKKATGEKCLNAILHLSESEGDIGEVISNMQYRDDCEETTCDEHCEDCGDTQEYATSILFVKRMQRKYTPARIRLGTQGCGKPQPKQTQPEQKP